jgi:hypothetical protein
MRLSFLSDASLAIGSGYAIRCLALTEALRDCSAHCTFVCRTYSGNLFDLIVQSVHEVTPLSLLNPEVTGDDHSAYSSWLDTDCGTDAQQTRDALAAQFDLIHVGDPKRDPAYFDYLGHSCKFKLESANEM